MKNIEHPLYISLDEKTIPWKDKATPNQNFNQSFGHLRQDQSVF